VQQRCRDAVYSIPSSHLVPTNHTTTATNTNTNADPNTNLMVGMWTTPFTPVHALQRTGELTQHQHYHRPVELVSIFNRLGAANISANMARIARLALIAPAATMAMVLSEAAQSGTMHAPLLAVLEELCDFAVVRPVRDGPTLLVSAIRDAVYPCSDATGTFGNVDISAQTSTSGLSSTTHCNNVVDFVRLLLNHNLSGVRATSIRPNANTTACTSTTSTSTNTNTNASTSTSINAREVQHLDLRLLTEVRDRIHAGVSGVRQSIMKKRIYNTSLMATSFQHLLTSQPLSGVAWRRLPTGRAGRLLRAAIPVN
jgi:hypothetical protein